MPANSGKLNGCNKRAWSQIEQTLKDLENGRHEGYRRKLDLLEERMKARLDTCEAQRRERMRNVMMIYEAEVKAANDDLKAEKETLKERMLQELREKKRKIMLQAQGLKAKPMAKTRNKKQRLSNGVSRQKELSFRTIRFTLTLDEIKYDLAKMKKPLQTSKSAEKGSGPTRTRRSTRLTRRS
ncbi:hypothetical protein AAMO2058_000404900 [Amorphochlora amoebiformis]